MNALQIMSPNKKRIDWDLIENNWLQLPKLFKVFHDTYDIKTIRKRHWYVYEGKYGLQPFGEYIHPIIPDLILDTIFELEKIEEIIPKVLDLEDTEPDIIVHNMEIIPIAYGPGGELLMLGVGENNADKIYYFVRHLDEYLKEISDNIFEFFKNYHIEIDETYLAGIPIEKLYKNWGDKFWKVRQNSEEV